MADKTTRPSRRGGFLFWVLALSLFITSCSSIPSSAPSESAQGERLHKDAIAQVIGQETRTPPASPSAPAPASSEDAAKTAHAIENFTIDEVIRIEEPNTANLYDNSRYDFPITVNSKVEAWIDYFTGRGRPHMERYLARSARYIPGMKEILRKNGLPEDLVYLALIESGFNLRARSRARAVGPWQFIKPTGKRYGLRVDAWIDERRDPIRSTEAAARYLKDLYLMFESWYLAASAYNAGEYKILRAIESLKTNNFWRICQTKLIRKETKDYVPKLIAAAIIAKNPKRYGFDSIVFEEPLTFEVVTIDRPIHLREIATVVDTNEENLQDLNPELMRNMVPPGIETYEIRVPVKTRVLVERALDESRSRTAANLEMPAQYTTRSGDTLAGIARKFRVKISDLANANNLSPKEKLATGTVILLPTKKVVKSTAAPKPKLQRASASETDGDFITHEVTSGESLWSISEKYNVTVQQIFKWNNLKRSNIHPGKRLRIKGDRMAGHDARVLRTSKKRRS